MKSQRVRNTQMGVIRGTGDQQIFVHFEMICVCMLMGKIPSWKAITQENTCSTIFRKQEEKTQHHTQCVGLNGDTNFNIRMEGRQCRHKGESVWSHACPIYLLID